MKLRLYILAAAIFIATLIYNLWYWGGASAITDLGPIIRASAEREAPIVNMYLFAGEKILAWSGKTEAAKISAESAFGAARSRLVAQPRLAMEDLFGKRYSSAQAFLLTSHWLCPVSLLVFIITWHRRPKKIQSKQLGRR